MNGNPRNTPKGGTPQPRQWPRLTAIGAAVAIVATVATNIDKVHKVAEHLLPSVFGSFDADISIDGVQVENSARVMHSFAGKEPSEAIEALISFVLHKTGDSPLAGCNANVFIGDEYSQEPPVKDRIDSGRVSAFEKVKYIFRKSDYLREQGEMRFICHNAVATAKFKPAELPPSLVAVTSTPEKPLAVTVPTSESHGPVNSTYYICIGEHRSVCGASTNWLPCGSDARAWARLNHREECAEVKLKNLSDVSGNQCGYATFEVNCTASSP